MNGREMLAAILRGDLPFQGTQGPLPERGGKSTSFETLMAARSPEPILVRIESAVTACEPYVETFLVRTLDHIEVTDTTVTFRAGGSVGTLVYPLRSVRRWSLK